MWYIVAITKDFNLREYDVIKSFVSLYDAEVMIERYQNDPDDYKDYCIMSEEDLMHKQDDSYSIVNW